MDWLLPSRPFFWAPLNGLRFRTIKETLHITPELPTLLTLVGSLIFSPPLPVRVLHILSPEGNANCSLFLNLFSFPSPPEEEGGFPLPVIPECIYQA